jgi:hypothetical protein
VLLQMTSLYLAKKNFSRYFLRAIAAQRTCVSGMAD